MNAHFVSIYDKPPTSRTRLVWWRFVERQLPTLVIYLLVATLVGVILAPFCLEPISKSPEEDNEAGELDKTQEVLCVVLPADEDPTLPLNPSKEALNEPSSHETT